MIRRLIISLLCLINMGFMLGCGLVGGTPNPPTNEVQETCEEPQLDDKGQPILPLDAEDVEIVDLTSGMITGNVDQLYGGQFNTSDDLWYGDAIEAQENPESNLCDQWTIGVPSSLPESPVPLEDDSELAEKFNSLDQSIYDLVSSEQCNIDPNLTPRAAQNVVVNNENFCFPNIDPVNQLNITKSDIALRMNECGAAGGDCWQFQKDPTQPFEGRDIILVHGMVLGPLIQKIIGTNPKADIKWPDQKHEFTSTGGYFYEFGKESWDAHIQNYIDGSGNRYLLVNYAVTQRLEYAVHAMLEQIFWAIYAGVGVEFEANDPMGNLGFCAGGCVIMSQSTGALVTDVAMSLAAATSANPSLQLKYGDLSWLPEQIATHVSLGGAFTGSPLSIGAIAMAYGITKEPTICQVTMLALNAIAISQGNFPALTCASPLKDLTKSVMVDLVPSIAYLKWGSLVRNTPIPVLMVSGGHPTDNYPVKYFLNRGYDDGVITMDSSCAKKIAPILRPSRNLPPLIFLRLYDMGSPPARSVVYYVEKNTEVIPPFISVAAACNPWKTPTGMIQPVLALPGSGKSQSDFYNNHYCLIQTSADHQTGIPDGVEPLKTWEGQNKNVSLTNIRNNEETSCIASNDMFNKGLVNSSFKSLREELVKGWKISFTINLVFKKIRITWWVWKRTYHLLQGWETKNPADYVYQYVLR